VASLIALRVEAGDQTGTQCLAALKEAIETCFIHCEAPVEAVVAAVREAIACGLLTEADEWHTLSTAATPLAVRLRRPAAALLAEAMLDPAALQRLAKRVEQLLLAAPMPRAG
jgi:hypothetical protein